MKKGIQESLFWILTLLLAGLITVVASPFVLLFSVGDKLVNFIKTASKEQEDASACLRR